MEPREKALRDHWPKMLVFVALLLLSLWMHPSAPSAVTWVFGALMVASALWLAKIALCDRRRAAKSRVDFAKYYVLLLAFVFVIALGGFVLFSMVCYMVNGTTY